MYLDAFVVVVVAAAILLLCLVSHSHTVVPHGVLFYIYIYLPCVDGCCCCCCCWCCLLLIEFYSPPFTLDSARVPALPHIPLPFPLTHILFGSVGYTTHFTLPAVPCTPVSVAIPTSTTHLVVVFIVLPTFLLLFLVPHTCHSLLASHFCPTHSCSHALFNILFLFYISLYLFHLLVVPTLHSYICTLCCYYLMMSTPYPCPLFPNSPHIASLVLYILLFLCPTHSRCSFCTFLPDPILCVCVCVCVCIANVPVCVCVCVCNNKLI